MQEQEMEIEALEAILMDDFKEIQSSESGLNTSNRCFQITISPQDDEGEEMTRKPVLLALIFSHTEKYPDEPPQLNLKSLRGIQGEDLRILKEKLDKEANENLGMAMVYTLVTSAKEWLSEKFGQDGMDKNGEEEADKDEIIVPHGEPVTVDTFLAWREKFEAELALERAKCKFETFRYNRSYQELQQVMPESELTAPKEKKLTGRQWFESGRASAKGALPINEDTDEEDEEDIDFDDEDFEDDEEDMLEHYLAEKSDSSAHSSRRAT
ncbi:RWD domain [Dillenia turbinata]|uniref:RWD domain n=1 Tax=Dillenia turbinata TaxID=194707 RepID=A0AAN8USD8_9MAGN